MKCKLLILFVSLFFVELYSQNEVMPNYTPPSPEASALTKYANVEVNEFRGMINHNIPLYTYKAGLLELPIFLSYNGAGVLVDDVPTWVGINWTLNAGGVITRTVYDEIDEYANTRIFPTQQEIEDYTLNAIDGTSNGQFLHNLASNGGVDSERDIFQFNFNGYSGSFYFDEEWNAKLIKDNQNLRIYIEDRDDLYNNKFIYIITPDGVKYTFGGIDATEDTSLRLVVDGSVIPNDSNLGTTSFYLKRIEHPTNGHIEFEYLNNLSQEILLTDEVYKISKVIEDMPDGMCCLKPEIPTINSLTTTSTRILNPIYLYKVRNFENNENIIFNSNKVNNTSFRRGLNSIIVDKDLDLNNESFTRIEFKYTGITSATNFFGNEILNSSKRFFLTQVKFNRAFQSNPNTKNEVFKFEYESPGGLPERFSFSQDFGGYFNDISNTSAIPNNSFFNPFNQPNFADRTPNFSKAKYGTLKKITYPTGGFTTFEYEACNKARKKNFTSIGMWAYRNLVQYTQINKLHDGIPQIDADGNYVGIQNVFANQSVAINVSLKAYINDGTLITSQNEKATLVITDVTTGNTTTHLLAMNSSQDNLISPGVYEKIFSFNYNFVATHEYAISIDIYPNSVSYNPIPLEANLYLQYYTGYDIVDHFGVRIKKITDFSKDNEPENIKRYYYSLIENINYFNPEELPFLDEIEYGFGYTDYNIINGICDEISDCGGGLGPGPVEYGFKILNLYSSKVSPLENFVYPEISISFGGDNFENGGIEKYFSNDDDYGCLQIDTKSYPGYNKVAFSSFYFDYTPNYIANFKRLNLYKGVLHKEKIYKKSNNQLNKIKQLEYLYTIIPTDDIYYNINYKKEMQALFFNPPVNENNCVSNFSFGVYKTESLRKELSNIQTIEYTDPVPIGVSDEANYKKITTTENYEYGLFRNLPTKITTINSDFSVNEKRKYYVNDYNNSLYQQNLQTYNIIAVQELNNKFIINNPIMIEDFIIFNNTINRLSTKRYVYKNFGTTPNFSKEFLHYIDYFKENGETPVFNKQLIFHEYLGFGKPSLVSLPNGTHTKYYYNSKNQVIMKIVGYIPDLGGYTNIDDIEQTNSNPCYYSNISVGWFVTVYKYNPLTDLLIEIIDPKCNKTTYHYDVFNRLQFIKDQDGNILQEFDLNYKPQN